ncbi:MAG: BlaI/MecI/CopY family transcriptional regulator [Lachnospiraceae bacterium]|nr:BlaI/MecI/CopY family transcriptional regulator [Lachnospiraceae bacterium]
MDQKQISLTNAEWNVMECLWQSQPRTVMQLVAELRDSVGWAKSTTITMLTRMEAKGLIVCDPTQKPKYYTSAVQREDAVREETQSFMERVFRGSVGLMMSNIVENRKLSREELDELYAILQKAEEDADRR